MDILTAKLLADMALGAGSLIVSIAQIQRRGAAGEPISAEELRALQLQTDQLRASNEVLLRRLLDPGA